RSITAGERPPSSPRDLPPRRRRAGRRRVERHRDAGRAHGGPSDVADALLAYVEIGHALAKYRENQPTPGTHHEPGVVRHALQPARLRAPAHPRRVWHV